MNYPVIETELKSISMFNSEALRCFALGTFFLNGLITVVVSSVFSSGPLSPAGLWAFHQGSWYLGILTVTCFSFGLWSLYKRKDFVTQIKNETTFRKSSI